MVGKIQLGENLTFDVCENTRWLCAEFCTSNGLLTITAPGKTYTWAVSNLTIHGTGDCVEFEGWRHDTQTQFEAISLPVRNVANGTRSRSNTFVKCGYLYWGAEYLPGAQR